MRDLREFHDPHLHLPIAGKTYTVKSPNAEFGLRIKSHVINGGTQLEEMQIIAELIGADYDAETDTMSGGLWDEMNQDGVALKEIIHVGNTAVSHFGVSPEFGEIWWETKLGKEHLPLVPEAAAQWAKERVTQKVKEMFPDMPEKTTS
ncbi:DUF7426 family protein [Corynebacterium sp. A21]|uniref:DUF7426 family protein n=1 Tax=Corynebacterium sp. A21 TaxID=3457318 RepID=UPI003FD493B6